MSSSGLRVVIFFSLLGLLSGLITGSAVYFRLFYLGTLLIVVSWGWSRLSLRGVELNRKARMLRAQVGQIFEERFEIKNTGLLPRLWISINNLPSLPHAQGSRIIPYIEGRRTRSYLARTRLIQRGIFHLGPTILESGDPFGLFPQKKIISPDSSLIVYPLMVEVTAFPDPYGILPGGESIRRRTAQVTPNAASVREYAPGDPLNRIHWISTAKRQRLISKEFELDPRTDVWILLDAMEAVQFAIASEPIKASDDLWGRGLFKFSLPPSTEEYCVSIAASLARYYLRQGRSVGLAFAGQALTILPPERGARQLSKILESLALLKASGEVPIDGLIEIQMRYFVRGSVIVLITPAINQKIVYAVDRLKRCGLHPIVILIDVGSFNGPIGTEEIYSLLLLSSVPTFKIRYGEDLQLSLSGKSISLVK